MRTGFLVLSCTALVWRQAVFQIPFNHSVIRTSNFKVAPQSVVAPLAILPIRYDKRIAALGTSREIRTHTGRVLSALSLPIGLGRHMVRRDGLEPPVFLC